MNLKNQIIFYKVLNKIIPLNFRMIRKKIIRNKKLKELSKKKLIN